MKAVVFALLLLSPLSLFDAAVPHILRNTIVKPVPREHTDDECLASAIHYEARAESVEGQRAVYEVIVSRAKALRKSFCGVVKAPKQFSWYGEKGKPILPLTGSLRGLLTRVKNHPRVLESRYRWFFSGVQVPVWALDMECRDIGAHRFCAKREE